MLHVQSLAGLPLSLGLAFVKNVLVPPAWSRSFASIFPFFKYLFWDFYVCMCSSQIGVISAVHTRWLPSGDVPRFAFSP